MEMKIPVDYDNLGEFLSKKYIHAIGVNSNDFAYQSFRARAQTHVLLRAEVYVLQ